MKTFFFKTFIFFLLTIVVLIFYLSYFGLETNRFNNLIKNKANEVNQHIKLDFEKTKIHLNPSKLDLVVKLKNPKILINNQRIDLSKFNLFLSIKSFFSSDFLLKSTIISFERNDIKDITKITNIFLPRILNKRLKKIFEKGTLEGELVLPFKKDGNIDQDYRFVGKVSDATIKITKEFAIKEFTTEIIHGLGASNNGIRAIVEKGKFYNFELSGSTIDLYREEDLTKIKSTISTKGNFTSDQIKKIELLSGKSFQWIKNDINGTIDLKTKINLSFNKKFKIQDLSYETEGNVESFSIKTKKNQQVENFIPSLNSNIDFKNTNIKFKKNKSNQILKLKGMIKLNNKYENFDFIGNYDANKKNFEILGNINLTDTLVNISNLNYKKEIGISSSLSFNINFIPSNNYHVKNLQFKSDKSKIHLNKIKFNNKFEILDLEKAEIKTFLEGKKNNDFIVNKKAKILISGDIFDAQPLLKSLYKTKDKKTFGKNFSSELEIKLNKIFTGTEDTISDFSMMAKITKGSYNKLNLKGNFSKNEIIEMSIYKINENKKTLQIVSDRARPFIKHFDFIKGFEGGKLFYESTILKNLANSNLQITDFKVSKVPALAQLLSLASLQGIADTLSGEGIRFESFEMKSSSKNNILNIEEIYASGPAISILMDGYVEKGKIVSLSGTLVPARTINSIIASIPLVGEILVGKKAGEGVFGVSFKMKGPPKDIKTTVNPIKTLTPRFIVRAVEKMKKQKEETK